MTIDVTKYKGFLSVQRYSFDFMAAAYRFYDIIYDKVENNEEAANLTCQYVLLKARQMYQKIEKDPALPKETKKQILLTVREKIYAVLAKSVEEFEVRHIKRLMRKQEKYTKKLNKVKSLKGLTYQCLHCGTVIAIKTDMEVMVEGRIVLNHCINPDCTSNTEMKMGEGFIVISKICV